MESVGVMLKFKAHSIMMLYFCAINVKITAGDLNYVKMPGEFKKQTCMKTKLLINCCCRH